jgi:uncharacterized protein (DUF1778 family)
MIMPKESIRTSRLEARIDPGVLSLVKRAAELQGRSVSDFVVTAAQEAAHKAIEEAGIIRLSAEDQVRFIDLLLNPPEISPAMLRAKEAHGKLFGSIEPQ